MAYINGKEALFNVKCDPDSVWPVGSIYLSVNATNPAQLFGGNWERIKDRFLLAAGSSYSAGATGGSATHTLTIEEMPSHNHNLAVKFDAPNGSMYSSPTGAGDGGTEGVSTWAIENKGGGQPHDNMPPYLAVYVWKRIS